MRTLGLIVSGLWESIRETLPSTTDEAGVFLAGMAWTLVLMLVALIVVSWLACAGRGC